MQVFEGIFSGEGQRHSIVVGRFNELIGSKLLSGAIDALKRHGVLDEHIDIAWVPGAYEIPLAAKKLASTGRYDSVICLGAVIRGNTPHFEYVSAEVSKGVAQVSLEANIPVIFGVLTVDSIEQAIERAGAKAGNKGFEAGVTALEMVNLLKTI